MNAKETEKNAEFNLDTARSKTSLVKSWRGVAILAITLFVFGCAQSVLPSERIMMTWSEATVRSVVLSNAPIGMNQADVEKALTGSFHRRWRVINYESSELMTHRGYSVPVSSGDYYLMSDFAVVRREFFASDVITVCFLFGRTHQLKDVAVNKWTDSI
jgi:hypothetical protein